MKFPGCLKGIKKENVNNYYHCNVISGCHDNDNDNDDYDHYNDKSGIENKVSFLIVFILLILS